MDKYEHRISIQELNQLIQERRFDEAAGVADTIDWSRETDPAMLCKVSDVYKINREYAKSRRILDMASRLDPQNPEIIYSLCELTIFLYGRDGLETDLIAAYQLNQQYQRLQPGSAKSLILQYKLFKVTNVSATEKIDILERLKSVQYTARWGYELALCYEEAGDKNRAMAECQNICYHFKGRYADKAASLILRLQSEPVETVAVAVESGDGNGKGVDIAQGKDITAQPEREGNTIQQPGTAQVQKVSEREAISGSKADALEQPAIDIHGQNDINTNDAKEDHTSDNEQQQQLRAEGTPSNDAPTPDGEPGNDNGGQNRDHTGTLMEGDTRDASSESQSQPQGNLGMSMSEVMQEWIRIRDNIRAQNDQKRKQKLLEDTGSLMDAFDETSQHTMLEEIERNVERQQRQVRQGYAQEDLSDGLTDEERRRAMQAGYTGYQTADPSYTDQNHEAPQYTGLDKPQYASLDEPQAENAGADMSSEGMAVGQVSEDGTQAYQEHTASAAGTTLQGQGEQFNTAPVPYQNAAFRETFFEDHTDGSGTPWQLSSLEQPEELAQTASAAEVSEDAARVVPLQDLRPDNAEGGDQYQEYSYSDEWQNRFGTPDTEQQDAYPVEQYSDQGYTGEDGADQRESGTDEYSRYGHTTRRWSAAGIKRAMAAQKAAMEQMEAHDRAALEKAVQNAENGSGEAKADIQNTYGASGEEPEPTKTPTNQERHEEKDLNPEDSFTDELTRAMSDRDAEEDNIPAGQGDIGQIQEAEQAPAFRTSIEEPEPGGGRNYEESIEQSIQKTGIEQVDASLQEGQAALERSERPTASTSIEDSDEDETDTENVALSDSQEENSAAGEETEEKSVSAQEVDRQSRRPKRNWQLGTSRIPTPAEDSQAGNKVPAGGQPGHSEPEAGMNSKSGARVAEKNTEGREDHASKSDSLITVESSRDNHDLSEEERKIFGPAALVKANRDQILQALDNVSMASETGNVIITGSPAGTRKIARGLLHMIRHSDSNFSARVAQAEGKRLNELGAAKITKLLDKIEDGAIQITGAGALSEEILKALQQELEGRERGIIVLLLDTPRAINELIRQYKDLLTSFNVRIDIQPLDDKALVAYGMEYALQQDYSIDEMAQLALSTRISSLQTRDHHVSTQEVKDIVDEAISYASRKNLRTLFAILSHRRYDEDDRIIIRERDFMHY